jgi:catechol 2,3-dioxygenase-like lactoylglutathione lyase family enzyme
MKVEKLDRVVIIVKDIKTAKEFFSDLLETRFDDVPEIEDKAAISPLGVELLELVPPREKYGIFDFHLKVPNIECAREEIERKGARHIENIEIGNLKEAIFHLDDFNLRLVLVEYKKPPHGAVTAAQRK